MGDSSNSIVPTAEENMAAPSKLEPEQEGTPSSVESTPELDIGPEASQEPPQPQKRKGGRKPIYATSEERKQRNRQAQAAFRERRTEYIKQLEATIKHNEDALSSLQQSHRSAADECLMLRYKNSLLERILLEKGIDVQSELQMKTGSPTLGFQHPAANVPQIQPPQPPLQRAAIQRQHARRSGHNFVPKLTPGQGSTDLNYHGSPQGHPTPSSHASSPTNTSMRSPMGMHQGGNTPPTSAGPAQPHGQQYHHYSRASQQPPSQAFYQHPGQLSPLTQRPSQNPGLMRYQNATSAASSLSAGSLHNIGQMTSAGNTSGATSASAYYPSPFQKHIDQLEQEYDAQESRSMLDQAEADENESDPSPEQLHGSYPPPFEQRQPPSTEFYQPALSAQVPPRQPQQQQQQQHIHFEPSKYEQANPQMHAASGEFGNMDIDPNDPMLDADPFGLSASMHYPTTYTFEHHQSQQQQHQHQPPPPPPPPPPQSQPPQQR